MSRHHILQSSSVRKQTLIRASLPAVENSKECNTNAKLRSLYYYGYNVFCHPSTVHSAGWLLCRYVQSGSCASEGELFSFNTLQGGISRLERYTETHGNEPGMMPFHRQLPLAARTKVARAAAIAGALDTLPLSFQNGHDGMGQFAKIIFEMGLICSSLHFNSSAIFIISFR